MGYISLRRVALSTKSRKFRRWPGFDLMLKLKVVPDGSVQANKVRSYSQSNASFYFICQPLEIRNQGGQQDWHII